MELKSIKAKQNGTDVTARFEYSLEEPWTLKINISDVFQFSSEASDIFEAFVLARKNASEFGLIFCCNGARLNVYPSSMSRSMSGGLVAYELTKGKQALRENLVKIFDDTEEEIVSSDEQERFYKEWLDSL